MKPRFQGDTNFNREIVLGLIRVMPSIDFVIADHERFRSLTDDKVLLYSADDNRILVTHDRRTMPGHFGLFLRNYASPGVLIISQWLPVKDAIDEILLVWTASEYEEWQNRLVYLPL